MQCLPVKGLGPKVQPCNTVCITPRPRCHLSMLMKTTQQHTCLSLHGPSFYAPSRAASGAAPLVCPHLTAPLLESWGPSWGQRETCGEEQESAVTSSPPLYMSCLCPRDPMRWLNTTHLLLGVCAAGMVTVAPTHAQHIRALCAVCCSGALGSHSPL